MKNENITPQREIERLYKELGTWRKVAIHLNNQVTAQALLMVAAGRTRAGPKMLEALGLVETVTYTRSK
jgi:hypothetical protein